MILLSNIIGNATLKSNANYFEETLCHKEQATFCGKNFNAVYCSERRDILKWTFKYWNSSLSIVLPMQQNVHEKVIDWT